MGLLSVGGGGNEGDEVIAGGFEEPCRAGNDGESTIIENAVGVAAGDTVLLELLFCGWRKDEDSMIAGVLD